MEGTDQNIVQSTENVAQNQEPTTQNVSIHELMGGSNPTPSPAVEPTEPSNATTQEDPTTEVEAPKVDDNVVLEYLKSKGKDVSSIDDLLKEPEVKEVEVNPYDELLSDEDKAYLQFKKETGGTKEDFQALNTDWDSVPNLKLAKDKIQKETGLSLTDEEVAEYIEEELGVNLNDPEDELSVSDKIKLKSYLKSFIDAKKSEQQNYKSNLQQKAPEQPTQQVESAADETVTLSDGTVMKKQDYDKKIQEYEAYKNKNKDAVNSVTDYSFNITIDDKGQKKELKLDYEFSNDDRHSMLSITEDTSKYINEKYVTESGFNHKQFNEDMFWANPNNRGKVIKALLQQARANAIEEVMKERGNVNLHNHSGLPIQNSKEGVVTKSIKEILES